MASQQAAVAAPERLCELGRRLEHYDGFLEAVAALNAGRDAAFDGVWGSGYALLAAELARHAPSTLAVVCPQQGDLDAFCEDLALFSSCEVARFPAWEAEPDERILYDETCGERLRTLKRLLAPRPPAVVIASIQSLMQPVPAREAMASATRRLTAGRPVDLRELSNWLASRRFHNTSAVELPGEFSPRGGIVDVFAPDWDQPVRLEFDGDQLESIRRFDVATQRSLESLQSLDITTLEPGPAGSASLTAYLPPGAWILLAGLAQIDEAGRDYERRLERPEKAIALPTVMQEIGRFAVASAAELAPGAASVVASLQMESVERFSGEMSRVRREFDQVGEGCEAIVVARTQGELERLTEIFRTTQLAARGALQFTIGGLRRGFRLGLDHLVLISGDELFDRTELRRPPCRRLGKAIDSFLELREGDLVVHLAHGIGRYRGLKLLEKDNQVEEHLQIEFQGGSKLFVPAAKIDLVQKYVGGAKSRPALARIGGKTWIRQKQAAETAVLDLASEMLELQAARAARPGITFNPESDWQREFNASFPYQETPDQLAAMLAVQADMERARPMDRLLCGDVGFGKTELAMRAVFKAVESGYQVAVLVPTTILAEQHFRTFRDRMAEFPVEIARLSRFCTAREQREIIEGIASGRVDVVIGTHRLVSSDVRFSNLGLVIIDEEQRFGVEVKERLKALRTIVDVMTMTATPIPRTLHMSLVGLRDISNLETPPADRVAVETRVSRFKAELVRHAVLRELNRGGQIFFVHNRVEDIEVVGRALGKIVPEAAIGIAHGQMPEAELERIMVDFVAHHFDVLLATTIVESGLDIPNANTIFINQADRYGLADLHQLRGRVGRYKHRAYCYLLVDSQKPITPNAARRLRAIEEFSDLGSGFAIAMRDLEIRGAGNLLGAQQSGHIAAVGYELYCQLLENAVRSLKHVPPKLSVDVDIDLPGDAYFPSGYVADMRPKIDLYRRLVRIDSFDALADYREELLDRFGPPPPPARRMLSLAALRIDAAVWGISAIRREQGYLVFRYTDRQRAEQLAKLNRGRLRVVDAETAYLTLPQHVVNPDQIIDEAKSVLRPA